MKRGEEVVDIAKCESRGKTHKPDTKRKVRQMLLLQVKELKLK